MTDRVNALVVVLAEDVRDDDCEAVMTALRMIRGVVNVSANVVDISDHVAQARARNELRKKLWAVLTE